MKMKSMEMKCEFFMNEMIMEKQEGEKRFEENPMCKLN
jgi:hypothetical protein